MTNPVFIAISQCNDAAGAKAGRVKGEDMMQAMQANAAPGYKDHPDHVVDVANHAGAVRIEDNGPDRKGTVIGESVSAFAVRETGYPVVFYLPRRHIDMSQLEPIDKETYCPFKGKARYWTRAGAGDDAEPIAWSYEEPYAEAALIAEHLAFYGDKVTISVS